MEGKNVLEENNLYLNKLMLGINNQSFQRIGLGCFSEFSGSLLSDHLL